MDDSKNILIVLGQCGAGSVRGIQWSHLHTLTQLCMGQINKENKIKVVLQGYSKVSR